MTKIFIFLILSIFNTFCLAGEVGKGTATEHTAAKTTSTQASIELGGCKPQIDPKTKTEEAFARAEAEKSELSKEELLARLIYSESLSTGYWKEHCNAKSEDDIMTTIGWGIMNRVKGKAKVNLDAYSDIIFGKSQFRTSFSSKKTNPFAEAFLCPLKSEAYLKQTAKKTSAIDLYKKSQKIANDIIVDYEKSGIPKEYKGITNFFYPQSEFFGEMRPPWAPDKDATKNKGYLNTLGVTDKPCVESYRLK
ncbi:MAG: hypothetical protein ACXVB1_14520 [Pseudobdellovibrionaceae bacterium]